MRNRLPWFLLAASLALNVFFVAGLAYPRLMGELVGHPGHPDRPDAVAAATRDFALNESQVEALEALRGRIAERREQRRGDGGGFRAILIDALRKPAFDRAALVLALEQRRQSSGDMVVDMTEQLHSFLAGLSPDQKAAFLERAEEDRAFLRRLLFPPRPRR